MIGTRSPEKHRDRTLPPADASALLGKLAGSGLNLWRGIDNQRVKPTPEIQPGEAGRGEIVEPSGSAGDQGGLCSVAA